MSEYKRLRGMHSKVWHVVALCLFGRHFHHQVTGALKTIKYHGQYRETDLEKLCDADLIITTYHTLASDFGKKRNPLDEIMWHRLVLEIMMSIFGQTGILPRSRLW